MEPINLRPVLTFLSELSANNNRPWFEEHRGEYEAARAEFERYTEALIDEFRVADNLQGLTAKDCISRIYRDIRFSKDKTPYHTHMWATIGPGGKKGMHMGYHVSVRPNGHSILAGGMYEPSPEQLASFRQSIDEGAQEFKDIIAEKKFVDYFGGIGGETVKTAPQGYDKNHPEIELLKHKQVTVMRAFTDEQVLSDDFLAQVVNGCKVMRPFLDYFQRIW